MSLRRVKLRDIGKIVGGGTPKTSVPENFGDEYPWITPKDLSRQSARFVSRGERSISQAGLESSSAKLLPAGTVLVSSRAPIGLTAIARVPVTTNQGCRSFVPGVEVDSLFMYYMLGSMTETFEQRANGSTFKEISGGTLAEIEVDIPDLECQRAVASTLGAIDDKIESNMRAVEHLDDLFHAYWRKLYDSLDGASEVALSDMVKTQYGVTASADTSVKDVKFLRVTDINKQNWITWDTVPGVSLDSESLEKYRLKVGDLLVARMADPGKSAIFDDSQVSATFASYLVRLKPRTLIESYYLYGFLKSHEYSQYAEGAKTGSVQKNMNARVIVDVGLKWPDQDQLVEFYEVATILRQQINQLNSENKRLSDMRDSLLPELLSGRIRVSTEEQISA